MSYCTVNGIDLHYQESGSGECVVLSHGIGGNVVGWWQQIRPLSEHFRVVAFDHRSFGLSGGEGREADRFVDDLEALLDTLGVDSVSLVGQSMGGFTCSGFASRHPERVRALVLSGSPAGLTPPRTAEEIAARLEGVTWEQWLRASVAHGGFPTRNPDLFVLYRLIAELNMRSSLDVLKVLGETSNDIAPIVEHGIPTMLISGEDDVDIAKQMDGIAAKIPGSERIVIPNSGHLAYGEAAAEFNEHVIRFLLASLSK